MTFYIFQANVEGKRCNKCRAFFFNLDSNNPDGCMPCFCFGVTSQCKCARGYRDKVTVSHLWIYVEDNASDVDDEGDDDDDDDDFEDHDDDDDMTSNHPWYYSG